jgi:hypothetical protein
MRELRVQYNGDPIRLMYALIRAALPCCSSAATQTGDDRWCEKFVPRADALYEQRLRELAAEGR